MSEMKLSVLLAALLLAQGKHAFQLYKDTDKLYNAPLNADVGDPLILTPYLKSGNIEEAQQAALVQNPNFQDVVSYAGYFTVDERFDSNMWFWFFPSADNAAEDPVVLWLNGGPGVTSMIGLFDENGPFIVNKSGSVLLREYSWHRNQSLLYFDNPVGAGFSFTSGGLARNETKVGADLYSALTQFFQLFPDLQKNDLFLSGESYAGKYLPALGHAILENNPDAELKLNLQGILIGDGMTDPVNQMNYGPFLYNVGLVGAIVRDEIIEQSKDTVEKIKAGNWTEIVQSWSRMLMNINTSIGVSIYDYRETLNTADGFPLDKYTEAFLNSEETRKALHVGNATFGDEGSSDALQPDIPVSAAPWMEELLENYRVLIYTGQTDVTCGYPMALDYLDKLKFSGSEDYRNSPRNIWYVDDEPAGYVRTGGNLVELLVRNSGHMVPNDQPKWAYDLLYRFTRNVPFA